MTAISAIIDKKNKKTYLASDQMGSNGFTCSNLKTKKLFKNNSVSFALCGSYRIGQILKNNLNLRNFQVDETVDKYVFDYMDVAIRETLKDRECLNVENGVAFMSGSEVIFAVKDRIFKLQSDLSVIESDAIYLTAGSGEFHQHGVIETLLAMKEQNYKKVLKTAIVITSSIVLSVGGTPQFIEHKH